MFFCETLNAMHRQEGGTPLKRLKEQRERMGLSQGELARRAGCAQRAISQ